MPVIPFAYPTHVVAEKMRLKRLRAKTKDGEGEGIKASKSEPKDIVKVPKRKDSYLDFEVIKWHFSTKQGKTCTVCYLPIFILVSGENVDGKNVDGKNVEEKM